MAYGNVTIDHLIRLRLSDLLPYINQGLRDGKPYLITLKVNSFTFGVIRFYVSFVPDSNDLVFVWDTEERRHRQVITMAWRDSNLGNGSKVPYLVCGGCLCRTLYSDCKGLYSRRQFAHHYHQQSMGRMSRMTARPDDPSRKYGKETYKGKLTPYGRRVLKYEEKFEASMMALMDLFKRRRI